MLSGVAVYVGRFPENLKEEKDILEDCIQEPQDVTRTT